jgi:hypothetical protein
MTSPAAAPADRAGLGATRVLLVWALILALLIAAIAAYYGLRATLNERTPFAFEARELRVVRGNAVAVSGGVAVRGTRSAPLTVLQLPAAAFNASSYERIRIVADPLSDDVELALLWATQREPGRVYEHRLLAASDGTIRDQFLDQDPNWRGDITSVAIGIKSTSDQPWRIARVTVDEADTIAVARGMRFDWTDFGKWNGKSINVEFGGRESQRIYLPLVLFVAAALCALYFAWRSKTRKIATPVAGLVLPFVAAWVVLDLRWQAELMVKANETLVTFAGIPLEERHLRMEDGELYRTLRLATPKLAEGPQRIFVGSDVEYFVMRAAYHLYPHNVAVFGWYDGSSMRPGDYVFLYRKNGVRFDATHGTLLWQNGKQTAADGLYVTPGAGLFRVR